MAVQAAGAFGRTPIERSDQRVAWQRADRAFFAAGACHVLAWVCRDTFPERAVELASVRFAGEQQVFHTFATWDGRAFDHSGWNPEPELLAVNQAFEGHPLERVRISVALAKFKSQSPDAESVLARSAASCTRLRRPSPPSVEVRLRASVALESVRYSRQTSALYLRVGAIHNCGSTPIPTTSISSPETTNVVK